MLPWVLKPSICVVYGLSLFTLDLLGTAFGNFRPPKFSIATENHVKRKGSSSNHHFSGASSWCQIAKLWLGESNKSYPKIFQRVMGPQGFLLTSQLRWIFIESNPGSDFFAPCFVRWTIWGQGLSHHLYFQVPNLQHTDPDPKKKHLVYLGGGFKYFLFSPLLGEMIQFD